MLGDEREREKTFVVFEKSEVIVIVMVGPGMAAAMCRRQEQRCRNERIDSLAPSRCQHIRVPALWPAEE